MANDSEILRSFSRRGTWFKGNLHCHSVLSDGRLTTEELRAAYKARGYHFLAVSDHNVYAEHDEGKEDFCLLPAFEYNFTMGSEDPREFHFNVFKGPSTAEKPMYRHMQRMTPAPVVGNDLSPVQSFIDDAIGRGCLVMLNHPHWSFNELEDVLRLHGAFAMEIYNHSSHFHENMGISTVLWDSLLRRGQRIWGTATDDNHNMFSLNNRNHDSFGGWVMVKAESLSGESIMDALGKGRFYSSSGPEIYSFEIDDGRVYLDCSPVERIYLVSDRRQFQFALGEPGRNTLTEFFGRLDGSERYVRMECVDASGRRAYTNPLFPGDKS